MLNRVILTASLGLDRVKMAQKKGHKILIADDDPEDQILFQLAIKEFDDVIQTFHAYNGNQLIEILLKSSIYPRMKEVTPSVIFTDIRMPFLDGLETIKKIRTHTRFDHIPIYAFTSEINTEITKQAMSCGVTAIFEKPQMFSELKKLIQRILSDL